MVVVRNGQLVLVAAAEHFQLAIDYDGGIASSLRPVLGTPAVRMDPRRTFGQPAVRNVRTAVMAEDFRAGTSRENLSELYDLSSAQVDEALRFELILGDRAA